MTAAGVFLPILSAVCDFYPFKGKNGGLFVFRVNFLCHIEGGPGLRPTGVKGKMGNRLCHFLFSNAVFLGMGNVIFKRAVENTACHEGRNGYKTSVSLGKLLLPRPHMIVRWCQHSCLKWKTLPYHRWKKKSPTQEIYIL